MGDRTLIEWCDSSWNPVTGCTPISEGCQRCYARSIATRFAGTKAHPNGFQVTLRPDRLEIPLRWRKSRRIFVCSMADLFHEDVPGRFINEVWQVIRNAPRHTFQILTKRPARLLRWTETAARAKSWPIEEIWPENAWLGVTAENQERADERIPVLLQVPAAVRFVSVEPMLGPVDLEPWLPIEYSELAEGWIEAWPGVQAYERKLHWVICGAETGAGKRPMMRTWASELLDQCSAADVPFFFKKNSAGSHELDERVWEEFPAVREWRKSEGEASGQ